MQQELVRCYKYQILPYVIAQNSPSAVQRAALPSVQEKVGKGRGSTAGGIRDFYSSRFLAEAVLRHALAVSVFSSCVPGHGPGHMAPLEQVTWERCISWDPGWGAGLGAGVPGQPAGLRPAAQQRHRAQSCLLLAMAAAVRLSPLAPVKAAGWLLEVPLKR